MFQHPPRNPIDLAQAFRRSVAVLASCFALSGAATADTFTIGIVPQFEPIKLAEIWSPILRELEEETGHTFEMIGSPRISEFEDGFIKGDFDFAYMNPYHFLVARKAQGYDALVRDGARELFGVLVVAKDSGIENVADLEGKTIAFPSPNALGAALLMRADLDRIHGLEYKQEYVSTHSSTYLNVALGQMDAGGGVMATLNRAEPQVRDRLRIIYETTRVPPHPFVAHQRIAPDVAEAVQTAFLKIADTAEGQELLARIPMRQAIAATSAEYDGLYALNLQNYWVD